MPVSIDFQQICTCSSIRKFPGNVWMPGLVIFVVSITTERLFGPCVLCEFRVSWSREDHGGLVQKEVRKAERTFVVRNLRSYTGPIGRICCQKRFPSPANGLSATSKFRTTNVCGMCISAFRPGLS